MTAAQPETAEQKLDAFLGIDIGSISTKGVIIDSQRQIIARSYQWTEGDPVNASRRVIAELGGQIDQSKVAVRTVGTTGSARRLVGAMCGASVIKNEITAHAVGTTFLHPDVRTILEIARSGQQNHLRGWRHRGRLRYEHAVRGRHGRLPFQPGSSPWRGGRAVRRNRSDLEKARKHRSSLHGIRRKRPGPQNSSRLRTRRHHRRPV